MHIFANFNGNLQFLVWGVPFGMPLFYAVLHVFTRIPAVLCGDFGFFFPEMAV
jgi:hypothetical protein